MTTTYEMPTNYQKLVSIATEVREAILRIADSEKLTGYCGIASYALSKRLDELGFKNSIWEGDYKGWGHAWVVCDGYIVDITATQFDLPEIYVIKAYGKGCGYRPMHLMENYEDFECWDKGCRPNHKLQREINAIIR